MYERNATDHGDYLWTNMIIGEVFPMTITPATWSVWQDYFSMLSMGDIPTVECIAGRPFLNYSLTYSFLLKIMRADSRVLGMIKDSIGVPPTGVDIPPYPVTWRTVLCKVLPREVRNTLKKDQIRKRALEFLEMVRGRCQELRYQIEGASEDRLSALWTKEIRPLWQAMHPLQDKLNEELNLSTQKLKSGVIKQLGEDEANKLVTTISGVGELASIGPLVGIIRLRDGELSREEYIRRFGYRGPLENELSEPRPYEDPDWIDQQLAELDRSPVDVNAMMERRDEEFKMVVNEITQRLPPKKAQVVRHQVEAIMETNTLREATRSELTHIVDVVRTLFLRAGELSGIGEAVFFLTVEELIAVLSGDGSAMTHISTRKHLYEQYRALPPLPVWIRGPFDPIQWAADPDRRRDVFDAKMHIPPTVPGVDNIIKGQPGSAGCVEGIVRQIDSPDEGNQLQSGEIMVTSMTNVGWTPLFPRAAAVITDIGGSLSHAAIVARELGIPAVVGCGDATIRLHTGDRVRVDGGKGIVEILEKT
jgi:phosphohistidine swiveling domain-containing protein